MIPKEKLTQILKDVHILPELVKLLPEGSEAWLVGGALRDCLLGVDPIDFDFAFEEDPSPIAKKFARILNGTWFSLDATRNQSRVVASLRGKRFSYDFAPLRASSLEQDLNLRDFTVNSLVLPLRSDGCGDVQDFLGGEKDLRGRVLKACSPSSMADDPLRVLKGVRHCAAIGLKIDEQTGRWMAAASVGLSRVASERRGFEVARILAHSAPVRSLGWLHQVEGERAIFGRSVPDSHHQELKCLFQRSESVRNRIMDHCRSVGQQLRYGQNVEGEWTLLALVHLALMTKSGMPWDVGEICQRLALGRKSSRIFRRLVGLATDALFELDRVAPRGRSRALWLDGFAVEPEAVLLFMGALAREKEDEFARRAVGLIADYRREQTSGKIKGLVEGSQVVKEFGCPHGPWVGRFLEEIRKAEIEGRITTLAEALKFLREAAKERD